MKVSHFLKSLLHIAFPLADRVIPGETVERLVGGVLTLPLRLIPVLLICAAYFGLVLLGEYVLGTLLYEFVVLLKLPKVFRVEWLEPEFFAMLGGYFRDGGFVVLGLYALYRVLGTAGSGVYLTARELVVLKRWPFSASILRVPLASIRHAALHQFPGERLLGTGRLELAWSDRESLVLPGVPGGESKLNAIMNRLNEQGPEPSSAHHRREKGGRGPGADSRLAPELAQSGETKEAGNSGRRRRRKRRGRGQHRSGHPEDGGANRQEEGRDSRA